MRCFVAIELPEEIQDRLTHLQEQMQSLGRAVRWTRADSIHLTVKFLGEVPDGQVAEVCDTARRIAEKNPVVDLEVSGAGCFPPRGLARIVWVGVSQPPTALLECQRECEDAFASMGFPRENRAYSPHLTIGRVNDVGVSNRIREALRQFEDFSAGAFTAEELTVFQSELRPSGAVYTPLARGPFKPT